MQSSRENRSRKTRKLSQSPSPAFRSNRVDDKNHKYEHQRIGLFFADAPNARFRYRRIPYGFIAALARLIDQSTRSRFQSIEHGAADRRGRSRTAEVGRSRRPERENRRHGFANPLRRGDRPEMIEQHRDR